MSGHTKGLRKGEEQHKFNDPVAVKWGTGQVIPIAPDYNWHIITKDFVFFKTSQRKLMFRPLDEVLHTHLNSFMEPGDYKSMEDNIIAVLQHNIPTFVQYSLGGREFISMIDRVDDDHVVLHEKFDDPGNRDLIKKQLMVAAGNFKEARRHG